MTLGTDKNRVSDVSDTACPAGATAPPMPSASMAAAHDLRNPLAIIKFSAVRLLPDGRADSQQINDGLRRILRSVHLAERLVEDLDTASSERAAFDMRFSVVPAGQLLEEAKTVGEVLASNASMTLDAQQASDLPSVRVDPDRIAQVFENLIGNATKFTRQGGHITIHADATDAEVRFSVADSGVGLSDEERTRAFAAYWQRDTGDRRGRGLGLWICREIIEAHGGRIWIEPAGSGTTVVFALPRPGRNA